MGRLMCGMFQKLYNVVRAGGATSTHGDDGLIGISPNHNIPGTQLQHGDNRKY